MNFDLEAHTVYENNVKVGLRKCEEIVGIFLGTIVDGNFEMVIDEWGEKSI
jgi:hypothetical protein